MASAGRQPDAPMPPRTPMELLTLREGEGYTKFDRHAFPILGAIFGFCAPILANRIRNRPTWSGIWQHFGISALFYFVGDFYIKQRMITKSEDYGVLKHYISLHPEEFPPYESSQIKYLYLPWRPTR